MKTVYEINYMHDPNIDERVKTICQQAENNYVLNLTKSNKNRKRNNKSQSLKNNYTSYQNEFINRRDKGINELSLDKTTSKSNSEENINILENPQKNNIIIDYNRNNIQESPQLFLNQYNRKHLL